jgi:protein SCO1/2
VRNVLARRGGAAVVATAVLVGLAGCGGSAVKAPPSSLGSQVDFAIPDAIRNLPLTEANGTTTTLGAFQGKAVMIADFLSLCTDICPMISANTAAMARAISADGDGGKVALLEISVDPQRDTPARLRAYQKLYGGPQTDWTLLRATPADTKTFWKFFGVEYQRVKEEKPPSIDWLTHKPLTYDVDHEDALIFIGPNGREQFVVNAGADVQGHLPPAALVKFLDPLGLTDLYHPKPVDSWTVSQGLSVLSWLLNHHLADPA